jgi:hypothetical protein
VIGSVVNFSGYLGYASGTPGSISSRLLDGTGSTLQALNNGRNGVDQIKAALTTLRDTLQSARTEADAIPGRTALQPVVADIEQTVDKPTYVTVNGTPIQNGTITVSLGTRPLIVGYERANRAPLGVGEAVKSLTATVATLVSTVGGDGTGGFAADVTALLRSNDFTTAVNRPDAAAIDTAIGRINDVLAKAQGLGSSINAQASSAAQVDLGALLLSATPNAGADSSGLAGFARSSPYRSNSNSASGTQISSWA